MDLEILITNKDKRGFPVHSLFFGSKTIIEIFDDDNERCTSHLLKAGEAKRVTIAPGEYICVKQKGT